MQARSLKLSTCSHPHWHALMFRHKPRLQMHGTTYDMSVPHCSAFVQLFPQVAIIGKLHVEEHEGQATCRSGGVAMMACLLAGGAPLLEARPPCMVIDVGEAYDALPVLTLPAESLLWEISCRARSSTSSWNSLHAGCRLPVHLQAFLAMFAIGHERYAPLSKRRCQRVRVHYEREKGSMQRCTVSCH